MYDNCVTATTCLELKPVVYAVAGKPNWAWDCLRERIIFKATCRSLHWNEPFSFLISLNLHKISSGLYDNFEI